MIDTDRLSLLPFSEEEASLFHKLNTDAFIRKYMWDDETIDQNTVQEILVQNKKHFAEDAYGIWKIQLKENHGIIGYVGLWYFFDEPQPQLIYALLEAHTQKGYATEASLAIIHYAFNQLGFTYLMAATDEPHQASQQVAKRVGMSFVEKRMENGKPTLFFRIENKI